MAAIDLSQDLLNALVVQAAASPRRRMHRNLHQSFDEPCQRLLNAIDTDSYIRPHRHALDPKQECLVCVKGRMGLLVFDDVGAVTQAIMFGTDASPDRRLSIGAEIPPGTWHTVVALDPGSILLEIKAGPFDPNVAKELAAWAPEEGSLKAPLYLAKLKQHFAG